MTGAAQVFALCHQQKQRDSSVLKMEACSAALAAGGKPGAPFCSSHGRESSVNVATGAQGSAAWCFLGRGKKNVRGRSQLHLEGLAGGTVVERSGFWKDICIRHQIHSGHVKPEF